MANLLDKMIEELKEANDGEDNEMIRTLMEKREELGDSPSRKEVAQAVQSCLKKQESKNFEDEEETNGNNGEDEVILSEEEKEYMKKATATVKEYLNDNHWRYTIRVLRKKALFFELRFGVKNFQMILRIYVEVDPNICRVEAVLPISADPIYEYPLCKLLEKESYNKLFGSFKYDERDGEITYEHGFLTRNGIDIEDLATYVNVVYTSATSAYNDIRKCCVGKFKDSEVNEILNKVNDLVNDIV